MRKRVILLFALSVGGFLNHDCAKKPSYPAPEGLKRGSLDDRVVRLGFDPKPPDSHGYILFILGQQQTEQMKPATSC